jgi:hypothetical protein
VQDTYRDIAIHTLHSRSALKRRPTPFNQRANDRSYPRLKGFSQSLNEGNIRAIFGSGEIQRFCRTSRSAFNNELEGALALSESRPVRPGRDDNYARLPEWFDRAAPAAARLSKEGG